MIAPKPALMTDDQVTTMQRRVAEWGEREADVFALFAHIAALTEQVYQLGVGRNQAELRWRDCEASLAAATQQQAWMRDRIDALRGLVAVARAARSAFEGRVAGEAYLAAGYAAMSAINALPASVRAELERTPDE